MDESRPPVEPGRLFDAGSPGPVPGGAAPHAAPPGEPQSAPLGGPPYVPSSVPPYVPSSVPPYVPPAEQPAIPWGSQALPQQAPAPEPGRPYQVPGIWPAWGTSQSEQLHPTPGGTTPLPPATTPGWRAPGAPGPRPARLGRALALLVAAIFVFAAGTAFGRAVGPAAAPGSQPGQSATTPSGSTSAAPEASPNFALIQQAYNILRQNYVDPSAADPVTLIQGAIKGMADALDDPGHTSYLTADELQARDQSLSGTFVGIGAVLDTSTNGAVIIRVLPNSPAEKAGVKAGEIIATVDGQSVAGLTVEQIVTKVRGPAGTPVTLGLTEPNGSQRTLTMTRQQLELPLVSWAFAPGTKVAVVRLESFSKGASTALKSAVTAAEQQGATAIALDLRGNPGGYVDEAINVASQFLASGVVYLSQDRSGTQVPHPVQAGGEATNIPLAVLVDGQTASAAEIVTGALQDAGRGQVIGEKTFGTGTVVGTFPLPDGSALTIGTERWFTPKGRAIWREGLVPDKTVALPTGVSYLTPDLFSSLGSGGLASSRDTQLQAAVAALNQGQAVVPASQAVGLSLRV